MDEPRRRIFGSDPDEFGSGPEPGREPAPDGFAPDELEVERRWMHRAQVDPEKFDFFYRKYRPRVFRYATKPGKRAPLCIRLYANRDEGVLVRRGEHTLWRSPGRIETGPLQRFSAAEGGRDQRPHEMNPGFDLREVDVLSPPPGAGVFAASCASVSPKAVPPSGWLI